MAGLTLKVPEQSIVEHRFQNMAIPSAREAKLKMTELFPSTHSPEVWGQMCQYRHLDPDQTPWGGFLQRFCFGIGSPADSDCERQGKCGCCRLGIVRCGSTMFAVRN